MKRLFRYAGFVLGLGAAGLMAQEQSNEATPAEQYQALRKEFQTAASTYFQSTNDAQRQAIVARVDKVTVNLLDFVQKNAQAPFALEALTHVVTLEYWLNNHTSHPGWGKESPQAKAITQLLRDHVQSDQLGETCKRVNFSFRPESETFLRTVLEKNPHRQVQGAACLRLAQLLAGRVEKLALLQEQPHLARRYQELYGQDYIDGLLRQDPAGIMKSAEAFYERAAQQYGDVKLPYNETVSDVAGTDLFEIRNLAVGKVALDIGGADQDGQSFKLSDYRGKVVLLYFWSEY